jgi:hypothetical protein
VGQLLALPPAQVRAIHAIGTKTANDIIAFQETLLDRGLEGKPQRQPTVEPPLLPDLCDSPEPVQKLPLGDAMRSALAAGQAAHGRSGRRGSPVARSSACPGSAARSSPRWSKRSTASARRPRVSSQLNVTARTRSTASGRLPRVR